MHRIGLIGGLSWTASAEYYRLINEMVQERLGGNHSADLVLRSLDFSPVLSLADDRPAVEDILYNAARDLINAGARHIALASFTGHGYSRRLRGLPIPLIDIAEAVCSAIKSRGVKRVGILATGRSLRDAVLLDLVSCNGRIDVITPSARLQNEVDRIIFDELAHYAETPASLAHLDSVVMEMVELGAETILLGTTEFGRIRHALREQHRLVDAAFVHCQSIVDHMLHVDTESAQGKATRYRKKPNTLVK